jgi:hypothetical protein
MESIFSAKSVESCCVSVLTLPYKSQSIEGLLNMGFNFVTVRHKHFLWDYGRRESA